VHNPTYVQQYDVMSSLKPGGSFLLNTSHKQDELDDFLPGHVKRYIANNDIRFYIIDAVQIAQDLGLGGRINTVCQAAFFKSVALFLLMKLCNT